MFRNYLITALRNFTRHRLYSAINVVGLSTGIACAILIVLFLRDELSYDRWIPGSSNIYRVELTFHLPGRAPWRLAQAPFPLTFAMQDQIPEVTAATHFLPERMTITVDDHQFLETVAVVDPNFFQVIRLPLVAGDPLKALADPESLVLSESIARKLFGATDPIGKTVTVNAAGCWDPAVCHDSHLLTVTGVVRDLPHNTQLAADLILPNSSKADRIPQDRKQAWTATLGGYDYIALTPGADPKEVLAKLKAILDQAISPAELNGAASRGSELESFNLTPFWDAHLTSDQYGGMTPPGNWTTVYGFIVIAVLILLTACFNFTNLATARAMLRAREISLRKAVGAKRSQLVVQFLAEALLTALISFAAALALVEVLLPAYDAFLGRPIAFHYLADWQLFLGFAVTAIVAGLLSGAYPALVLSKFRPASVLKRNASAQTGSGLIRTALVTSQFAVSIALGITAIVVFSQIKFARHVDLGFGRDGVVVIRDADSLTPSAQEILVRTLRTNPKIIDAALSNVVPFDLFEVSNDQVGIPGETQTFSAHIMSISPAFPHVYDMRLIAGRLLSVEHSEDRFSTPQANADMDRNVMINAAAAGRFGYQPEAAVGKVINLLGGTRVKIVGVLGDAKIDGMRDPVLPTVYLYSAHNSLVSVRIRGEQVADTLGFIDKTWRALAPGSAIQRYFLNDAFNSEFKSDEKQGAIFSVFVGVAISIACLGLFGLAAFTAQRRTKEIGIRKVFGARTSNVVRLLLWQFSIPVLIANAIAWPIAYYYLHHWLESYAYRIALNPFYFIAAGTVALTIAWITVVAHALRVARANPIRALRHE